MRHLRQPPKVATPANWKPKPSPFHLVMTLMDDGRERTANDIALRLKMRREEVVSLLGDMVKQNVIIAASLGYHQTGYRRPK